MKTMQTLIDRIWAEKSEGARWTACDALGTAMNKLDIEAVRDGDRIYGHIDGSLLILDLAGISEAKKVEVKS